MYILYNRFYFIIEVVARFFYGRAIIFILSLFDVYPFCCRLFTSSPMALLNPMAERRKKKGFQLVFQWKQNKRNECGYIKLATTTFATGLHRLSRWDLRELGEMTSMPLERFYFFFFFLLFFLRKRKSVDDKSGAGLFGYINSKLWLDNRE